MLASNHLDARINPSTSKCSHHSICFRTFAWSPIKGTVRGRQGFVYIVGTVHIQDEKHT
jgi:hypothetical protein